MKKIIVTLLVLVGGMIGTQLHAKIIPSENLSVASIRNILSEKYGTKIDEDNALVISTGNGRVILKVVQLKKIKILRIYASFSKYDKATTQELIILANKWNDSKRFLRVSVDLEDGSSTCDYYLVCVKGVDGDNLLESIEGFISLRNSWEEFVVSGGKE